MRLLILNHLTSDIVANRNNSPPQYILSIVIIIRKKLIRNKVRFVRWNPLLAQVGTGSLEVGDLMYRRKLRAVGGEINHKDLSSRYRNS